MCQRKGMLFFVGSFRAYNMWDHLYGGVGWGVVWGK